MTAPRTDAGRRGGGTRRWLTLLVGFLSLAARGAGAAEARGPDPRWAGFALLGGAAQPVSALADDQWDVGPHPAWGAEVLAGAGAFSTGVRWWRSGTTQRLGLAGVEDPAVHTGSIELLLRARLVQSRRLALLATASGGRLAITYHPEHLTIPTGGAPVEVELAPIHDWVGGAGLALALPLTSDWTWGVETERRLFALDTAHRSGSTVTLARERFGDWSARVSLARAWRW